MDLSTQSHGAGPRRHRSGPVPTAPMEVEGAQHIGQVFKAIDH